MSQTPPGNDRNGPPATWTGTADWDPRFEHLRKFPRWRVDLMIHEVAPEDRIMLASSISEGGLYCPDVAPLPPGSILSLEIEIARGMSPILTDGKVVYAGCGIYGLGLGIQFISPQQQIRELLGHIKPTSVSNI